VPTALTLAIEWPHLAPVGNLARFVTALPLGAAIAYTIAYVTTPDPGGIGVRS